MDVPFRYRATLSRVIDGDTIEVLIDLGFQLYHTVHLRLRNVYAPELNTDAGKAAKAWLANRLGYSELIVETFKTKTGSDLMTFTRYVADVFWKETGACLNDEINRYLLEVSHRQNNSGESPLPQN